MVVEMAQRATTCRQGVGVSHAGCHGLMQYLQPASPLSTISTVARIPWRCCIAGTLLCWHDTPHRHPPSASRQVCYMLHVAAKSILFAVMQP